MVDEYGHGAKSSAELDTCHPDLQTVFRRVGKRRPNTILDGSRTEAEQALNVRNRVSFTMESDHRPEFSEDPDLGVDAVDVAPDPLRWPQLKGTVKQITELVDALAKDGLDVEDRKVLRDTVTAKIEAYALELARWAQFSGYVLGVADELFARREITARIGSGSDWNRNNKLTDHDFLDWPHYFRVVER